MTLELKAYSNGVMELQMTSTIGERLNRMVEVTKIVLLLIGMVADPLLICSAGFVSSLSAHNLISTLTISSLLMSSKLSYRPRPL